MIITLNQSSQHCRGLWLMARLAKALFTCLISGGRVLWQPCKSTHRHVIDDDGTLEVLLVLQDMSEQCSLACAYTPNLASESVRASCIEGQKAVLPSACKQDPLQSVPAPRKPESRVTGSFGGLREGASTVSVWLLVNTPICSNRSCLRSRFRLHSLAGADLAVLFPSRTVLRTFFARV